MTLYWTEIHTQIFGTMLQIRHVMAWMISHREQLPDQVSLFLGAYIITAIAFARKTLEIAFLGAWERMAAAGKFRQDFREQQPDISIAYPPDYYALLMEAQAFATLAAADTLTGMLAGDELERREKQAEDERRHFAAMAEELRTRNKDSDHGET